MLSLFGNYYAVYNMEYAQLYSLDLFSILISVQFFPFFHLLLLLLFISSCNQAVKFLQKKFNDAQMKYLTQLFVYHNFLFYIWSQLYDCDLTKRKIVLRSLIRNAPLCRFIAKSNIYNIYAFQYTWSIYEHKIYVHRFILHNIGRQNKY